MTEQLSAPMVDAEVDLRGYEFMPLYGDRLKKSETWIMASPEGKVAAIELWWHSYAHEVPAGSLPNNDRLLAQYAGYGSALKAWKEIRDEAMRGWVLCGDGRLYHRVVAELAKEAWKFKLAQRNRTKAARDKRLSQKSTESVTAQNNPSNREQGGQLQEQSQNEINPATASTGQDRTGQDITFNPKSARAVDFSITLRSLGIDAANPQNPTLLQWEKDGVTVQQVIEAVNISRKNRGKENPAIGYLNPIIGDMLHPPEKPRSQTAQAVENLKNLKDSLG